ncbi:FAD-dependent oxidoreductase [bacterium]|nr:FAD-dependent oxidoreductase [bacterium]
MIKNFVIIGGNAAGLSAASQVKRIDKEHNITVLEKKDYISYSTCSIPFILRDEIHSPEDIILYTPEEFKTKRGINIITNANVFNVEPLKREVHYKKNNSSEIIHYDKLIIATGAAYITFPSGVKHFTPAMESYFEAKALIDDGNIKDVAVIGGGFTGVETAYELSQKGVKVNLIEFKKHLLPSFSILPGKDLNFFLKKQGINVLESTEYFPEILDNTIKTSKGILNIDAVFFTAGLKPNTDFINNIDKLANGAIKVNQRGETSISNIYAGGDCANYIFNITKKPIYAPLGTYANRIGRLIGKVACGAFEPGMLVNNSQVLKLGNFYMGKSGSNDKELKYNKIVFSNAPKISGNNGKVNIVLYADENSILKGGEIWGNAPILRHLNLISAFINKPLLELYQTDIPYTPTINHTWDGITIAAYELMKKI